MRYAIQGKPESAIARRTLPDAIGLYHLRWRKKKVDGFIIPPKFFYNRVLGISVDAPEILDVPQGEKIVVIGSEITQFDTEKSSSEPLEDSDSARSIPQTETSERITVSAFSLSAIRAKKEIEQQQKEKVIEQRAALVEDFSETDMLMQWNKYAQRMSDKGQKIMESLMLLQDPKLQGYTVIHELPNESSKLDFENGLHDLTGYLRGKLHNHDLTVQLKVNEAIDSRMAFTPQDRYNRLTQINPALDALRRTFDLDF